MRGFPSGLSCRSRQYWVRVGLLSGVAVVVFYYFLTATYRQLPPKHTVPANQHPPPPVDVADGQQEAGKYRVGDDTYSPIAGKTGLKSQDHYFAEAATVPTLFDKLHSTLSHITSAPKNLLHRQFFREDPRREDSLKDSEPAKIYNPYPDYESDEWQSTHRAPFQPCMGPRGVLLNESLDDLVSAYMGAPEGFPEPAFGSHALFDMDSDVCFDRYSRYGPYGFGDNEPFVEGWIKPQPVNWQEVDWGTLQEQCAQKNAARFSQPQSGPSKRGPLNPINVVHQHNSRDDESRGGGPHWPRAAAEKRSVFLIRSYTGKDYSENDKLNIRSMVTELSLLSGGQYEVILLVHSRDDNVPIWEEETYQRVLKDTVPKEFWNITVLWNMKMVKQPYTNLNDQLANVHTSQWLPVQAFAREHPEFEYFWNWEIDSRFTGHMFEFAEQVAQFARRQPRKGIWERSGRFWIPSLHGDYDKSFREYVRRREDQFVWGPLSGPENKDPIGPRPPVPNPADDDDSWGVGEEADYISFLPIFNPGGTNWVMRDQVFNYQDGNKTPRRCVIITQSRISRRLLKAMHIENAYGRHLASEMFPATAALHHSLKAVFAPHPIYSDKNWHPHRLDRWFNSGEFGQSGSGLDSPYGWALEHRFLPLSWYYRCNLAGPLYRTFMGWKDGGKGGKDWEKHNGRMCLPPVMLHPIKDMDDPNANTQYDFPKNY